MYHTISLVIPLDVRFEKYRDRYVFLVRRVCSNCIISDTYGVQSILKRLVLLGLPYQAFW